MKTFLSLLLSILIIGAAYSWAFGVPDALSFLLPDEATQAQQPDAQRGGRQFGGGTTTVVLTQLVLEPYEDVFRAVGSSDALQSAVVSSVVAGRVTAVNLTSNTDVAQGDVLVQLDARLASLNVQTAQSELDQAADTVARYERLQEAGSSTISAVAISDARLAQSLAAANLGVAELALADRTIRAPFSGTLGLSDLSVGDTVAANSPIVTIDNASALVVGFELSERSIGLLSLGRKAVLATPSFVGRTFEGEIISFDSRIDPITRSVTVKARVENPDGLLWPGMTFTIEVTSLSEPLPMVPSTALVWSRDGASIWYDDDGTAASVPATILFRHNDQVWLDVDVAIGTMVVTEGAHKLRPGSAITDANAAPLSDSAQPRSATWREDPT